MNFTLGRRLKDFVKIQFFFKPKNTAKPEINENGHSNSNLIKKLYYDSGAIKAEIQMKNGKLNGPANLYYENGKIKAKEFYRENDLQGLSRWYYEAGGLQSEKYYEEGKHIYTKEYDRNGNLKSEQKFKS